MAGGAGGNKASIAAIGPTTIEPTGSTPNRSFGYLTTEFRPTLKHTDAGG
jgi:hypothetical protein